MVQAVDQFSGAAAEVSGAAAGVSGTAAGVSGTTGGCQGGYGGRCKMGRKEEGHASLIYIVVTRGFYPHFPHFLHPRQIYARCKKCGK